MNIRGYLTAIIAGVTLGVLPAFAQESTPTLDTTQIETLGTSIQAGLSAMVTAIGPILVAIILVGLGIWLIPAMARIFMRAFNSGKGR